MELFRKIFNLLLGDFDNQLKGVTNFALEA